MNLKHLKSNFIRGVSVVKDYKSELSYKNKQILDTLGINYEPGRGYKYGLISISNVCLLESTQWILSDIELQIVKPQLKGQLELYKKDIDKIKEKIHEKDLPISTVLDLSEEIEEIMYKIGILVLPFDLLAMHPEPRKTIRLAGQYTLALSTQ